MDENSIQETEIPPKKIFEIMKSNIFDNFIHFSLFSINKDYLNSRKSLFNILHKITVKMGFKSQTFFLSAHFLDIIFTKKKRINMNLNILGLSCLCLAAKYCENDPIVPHLQYFIKIFNNINGYKNAILMSELKKGEVVVLKILNYKLNYFTIYDFDSFLFGHGILKIEQLKYIENSSNKKLYRSSRKKFVINNTNSLMIKNILEKVYKKSRYYLDVIVKNTKICFKYNPLFISIYIMKKSVEEILGNERKINSCNEQEKKEFYEKNNACFKQIMNDFYKINYEENEQYKRILEDEEFIEIFESKEKTEGPAPLAIDNNKKNLFINTYSTGFYNNKLKLKDNININNTNNNNNLNESSSSSSSEKSKEEDDLEKNLNINEIQNAKNKNLDSKKNSTSYNFYSGYNSSKENKNKLIQNKYIISTVSNADKKNISNNNYDLTYSVEPLRNKIYINNNQDKNSPLKFNITDSNNKASYTGIKKYIKIKLKNNNTNDYRYKINNNYNENINDKLINCNSNTNINSSNNNYNYNTIKKYEKQPYFKKLINNDSTINSINRTGLSSYLLNTELNKNKNNRNIANNNNNNNISTIEQNKTLFNPYGQTDPITTSSRFRKMLYRNKINENNVSTEIKNANELIIKDSNKKEIESYTQYNWNKKKDNVFIKKSRVMNLNLNDDKKNLTSMNFYKNNINKDLNIINNLKDIKEPEKRIVVNTIENSASQRVYQSIRHKYLKLKNNKINNDSKNNLNLTTNNTIDIIDKNSKTSNNFYKKSININKNNQNNQNSMRLKYLFKKNDENNNITNSLDINNVNNNNQIENNKYKKFGEYSIYSIFNKTKNFFSKNNKEEKTIPEKKNDDINIINNTNASNNSLFYKSQQDFYHSRKEQEKKEIPNVSKINNHAYLKNIINRNKINKDNQSSQNKKNSSTIVINNNININIGNKTNHINNEYTKYKNIYKRNNNIPSQLNSSNKNNEIKAEKINSNDHINSINNSKSNRGINFGNLLQKFRFYRKAVNKNNIGNNNNSNNNN